MYTTDDARDFELDPRPARVVAFGSQLVFGSVGLNAAMPVYEEAGVRCAAVPTLVLSNLPHYPSVQTVEVTPEWIDAALRDLGATGALRAVEAIAVGYLASPGQAHAIAAWYRSLDERERPPLILDPTFGDSDVGFYTDPAVAPALRDALVPLAAVLTPNRFELEHLVGPGHPAGEASDEADSGITGLARRLLLPAGRAPSDHCTVIVTGVHTDEGVIDNLIVTADEHRTVSGPEIATWAKGLGDTFTAALVTRLITGDDVHTAVAAAAARVRYAIEHR
ncbi:MULTISPECIES: bifunctional hydroxymethylpyrimidine kinase/phosphomethylpyrimidine kinase [Gordonia]|uniref:pyridoxal kinase n=1 Tax=Gordonia sihwensis NBRC 108236 TaxID=1223544 RepID=L7LJ75_9ACTN|nr:MULTISPECIES: bifunctional hydroxymethylpyrimidine kinase/phosphomethylpyrimidine kinase [Gordonia]AUH69385.1 bifunctional pyridoxal kinase/hydroxymethylpyrimidine kinase [Gordonia sp. YC-JH1]MBY4571781.1 hypothetical protein [Gordonia sihwensis]GAC61180.1 putative pyridoxal kinase [Gordonia sihwensis NBRC 108236]